MNRKGAFEYRPSESNTRPKRRPSFWFCYVDGQGTPNHKHYSEDVACKEADRLARQYKADVFVLKTIGVVRYVPPTPPPDTEWQETID